MLPSARKAIDVDRDQREVTSRPEAMSRMCITLVRCLEHSGQRMPTGVVVMQSGQIGRPQLEQETPVSREGWR
jgi:hypothetical protein